jgi:AcrR family transcriptional regulator
VKIIQYRYVPKWQRVTKRTRARGRKRDSRIDKRVLEVAGRQLATSGYDALSIAAVAHDAGTTRQAVYRRWPTKASLAAAALQRAVEEPATPDDSSHPYRDLVAELANFQQGVSRPGRMSLVGTMLQDGIDPAVRARYQERVIAPRRRRLRAILERAREQGLIDEDADLEIAVTLGTGSWYARALAGSRPPRRWPERTAALVWRAVGGSLEVNWRSSIAPGNLSCPARER